MKKYYEEAKYNAAFDRCVDVMSQMLQKYGHQVLDKLEQDTPQTVECSKDDKQAQPLTDKAAYKFTIYTLRTCCGYAIICTQRVFLLFWRKDEWIVKTEL